MSNVAALIDTHLAAYGEPDRGRRSEAVKRIWASGAQLIDPPLAAVGHDQIVAQAEALLSHYPGHRFRRSSGVDAHHGYARYAWQLLDPQSQVVLEGIDFARLDDRGQLELVTGFFGPLPAHETSA